MSYYVTPLTCPVCDRSGIEGDICPNCETNLSMVRVLAELPLFSKSNYLLLILLIFIFLVLGISIGVISYPKIFSLTEKVIISPVPISVVIPQDETCGGFYYVVREGDSLILISSRLYGKSDGINIIVDANPSLKNREDKLEIGEVLFIPNSQEVCAIKHQSKINK